MDALAPAAARPPPLECSFPSSPVVAAQELERVGVRVNCVAPVARTRLTENVPGFVGEMMKDPKFDPAEVSPLVAWLASADCPLTGRTFAVQGGGISQLNGWTAGETVSVDEPWTVELVAEKLGALATT